MGFLKKSNKIGTDSVGPICCQAQLADGLQAIITGTVYAGVKSQALGLY